MDAVVDKHVISCELRSISLTRELGFSERLTYLRNPATRNHFQPSGIQWRQHNGNTQLMGSALG
jgi:hypothetical protein